MSVGSEENKIKKKLGARSVMAPLLHFTLVINAYIDRDIYFKKVKRNSRAGTIHFISLFG